MESFLVNPIVVHMEWEELKNHQFLQPPPLVRVFLNEATIDSELLAALKQATDRLLLSALEGYEDSGTTQKEDVKKTSAKTLPSTLINTVCKDVLYAFLL